MRLRNQVEEKQQHPYAYEYVSYPRAEKYRKTTLTGVRLLASRCATRPSAFTKQCISSLHVPGWSRRRSKPLAIGSPDSDRRFPTESQVRPGPSFVACPGKARRPFGNHKHTEKAKEKRWKTRLDGEHGSESSSGYAFHGAEFAKTMFRFPCGRGVKISLIRARGALGLRLLLYCRFFKEFMGGMCNQWLESIRC